MKKSNDRDFTAMERRNFLKRTGIAGLGIAAGGLLVGGGARAFAGERITSAIGTGDGYDDKNVKVDTAQEIFTAALIAEDLATTFYYNGLVGPVIQDPALAGPGGTATSVLTPNSDDVGYLRAALSEEMMHADLLRELIGGTSFKGDPFQTFYFPTGSFTNLPTFLSTLNALENAFIGAYLTAVREFSKMAGRVEPFDDRQFDFDKKPYTRNQLTFFAEVCAAIMGVESEHRALGRDLGGEIPANNLCYEQTDGLTTVFNGPNSAVAALTPFVTKGTAGFSTTAYSLATARNNAENVTLPCTGGLPTE